MLQFLSENYRIWLSLHIIFVVSWFAGLFYIVRLFVYHEESKQKSKEAQDILHAQFTIMEWRLWNIITTPAMIGTILFGLLMLVANTTLLSQPWMQVKLAFVVIALIYHIICQQKITQFKHRKNTWTSTHFRLWNELATLILVAVVFLVVRKDSLSAVGGVLGFFGVGIALMFGVRMYKKYRKS
jgi:protoporphyrinogen IX oxidase